MKMRAVFCIDCLGKQFARVGAARKLDVYLPHDCCLRFGRHDRFLFWTLTNGHMLIAIWTTPRQFATFQLAILRIIAILDNSINILLSHKYFEVPLCQIARRTVFMKHKTVVDTVNVLIVLLPHFIHRYCVAKIAGNTVYSKRYYLCNVSVLFEELDHFIKLDTVFSVAASFADYIFFDDGDTIVGRIVLSFR